MQYDNGSYRDLLGSYDIVVFNVNGTITKDGESVMKKGMARDIVNVLPALPKVMGSLLSKKVKCYSFVAFNKTFIAFPNKHQWWQEENFELIKASIEELIPLLDPNKRVIMEHPILLQKDNEDVRALLKQLGDNVTVCI